MRWRPAALLMIALSLSAIDAAPIQSPYVSSLEPSAEHAARLESLLSDGFNRRIPLSEFQNRYRKTLTESSNDPAVAYAFALSLVKRSQYDDALAELVRIRGYGNASYLPAWRASIWLLLTRKKYDEAFEELRKLSEMLNDPAVEWTSPAKPLDGMRWIGALLAGLDLDLIGLKERGQHLQTYVEIERSLNLENRAALHLGVDEAVNRQLELEAELASLRGEAIEAGKKSAEEEQEEIEKQKILAEKKKEELKLTAEEWKQKLDAALLEFSKRIGERQREFGLLDASRQATARSIEQVQQQLLVLQAVNLPPSAPNRPVPTPAEESLRLEISLRQQQLFTLQARQTQTLAALEQVRIQGNQILSERAALIQEYQKATGQLVREDQEIDKAAEKFAKRQAELKTSATLGDSRETRQFEQKIKSFETYIAFDLSSESQRLVDAHSPSTDPNKETVP